MKWILLLCALATSVAEAALPSTPAPSTSNPSSTVTNTVPSAETPAATEPERYLFLVETSVTMQKLNASSRQAIFDLVHWGVDGHMEGGDTYGLWTFNEDVQSGIFAMQVYDPDLQLPLATQASLFLKDQPYEKKSEMSHLVLKLLSVVISVKDLNIFIITDGDQPIVGMRFDDEIKAACEARRKEARRTKKPFIVTMTARGGDITHWSVTLPGDKIVLPPRRPAQPKPVVAQSPITNVTSRTIVPSITMTASRPTTIPSVEHKQPVRDAVVTVTGPESGAIEPVENEIKPAVSNSSGASSAIDTNREAAAAAAAQRIAAATMEAEIIRRVSNQVALLTKAAAEATNLVAKPVPAVPPAAPKSEITVAAREPGLVPGAVLPSASRSLEPVLSATELVIAGVVLLMIAAGLIFILFRRSNPAGYGSSITRSMDR